jgi:ABC-type multidrug transport system fused ATPase/permease subunit
MSEIRRTARYLRRYLDGVGIRLSISLLFGFLQSASVLPVAWLIRRAFDQVIPAHNIRLLVFIAAAIMLATLATSGFGLATRLISLRATRRFIAKIRTDLIVQYYQFPRSFHDKVDRGTLHNMLVQDTQQLDTMINALIPAASAALQGLAFMIVLGVLDAKLFCIVILAVPAMRQFSRRIGARVRISAVENREAFARFSNGAHLGLTNMDLTRYQTAEGFEIERHRARIDKVRSVNEKLAWLQTAYGIVQSTVVSLTGVLILVLGGIEVANGRLTIGALLSFYVVMALLSNCASQVMGSVPAFLTGFESLRALSAFAELMTEPPYRGTRRMEFQNELSIHNVSFSYGSKKMLQRVSLQLRRGAISILLGTNGGGKTSLSRLILGLYRPSEGYLAADGIPFDEIDLHYFRKGLAFTAQDPELFAGTIRENICYGLEPEQQSRFQEACVIALVDEFVQRLPDGYNTRVGEDGAALSGGQRQKISIARALARMPKLLILDEPTNHLDPASVGKLMANLTTALAGNPAVLIITQNQSIVGFANFCYRLSEGTLEPVQNLGCRSAVEGEKISV